MAQQISSTSTSSSLYPQLETSIASLDESESYQGLVRIERDLAGELEKVFESENILENVGDRSILPPELFTITKRVVKPKLDPIKKLQELPTEEAEDEEETEDEDDEDEEVVEDEEEDAGGDYLVSHFDNGENYEDNDEENDDMTI